MKLVLWLSAASLLLTAVLLLILGSLNLYRAIGGETESPAINATFGGVCLFVGALIAVGALLFRW